MFGDESSLEDRFEAYIASLTGVFAHADRAGPLHDYCSGLLLPMERKSVEPMAAVLAPSRTSAKHQSLLHFVGQGGWSDALVLARIRELVLPSMQQDEAIAAWIVDDTGIAKKGVHSVGVARQYCGRLGKQDNCQVAVSLSVANHSASLPVAYRLFLPEAWANDPDRRAEAGIPANVTFQSKPQIALDQIRCALAEGVARGVVLADAGYGNSGAFRAGLTEAGLPYVVGIQSNVTVWPPGQDPLPAKAWMGRGRPAVRLHRSPQHTPLSARQLAISRRADFSTVTWRELRQRHVCLALEIPTRADFARRDHQAADDVGATRLQHLQRRRKVGIVGDEDHRSYRFFILADGRIVIVDPDALTIVYIIEA